MASRNREIKWGRHYRYYDPNPKSHAFDLLMSDAIAHGYLKSGFTKFDNSNVAKIVCLDRFCRDHLDAELLIGESTGTVNGVRFKRIEDCIGFKLRLDFD